MSMHTRTVRNLRLFLAFAFLACKTQSASNVATSEMTADISATSSGSGTTNVAATFRQGAISLTFIQLTADDKLTVTSGSTTKTMTETSLLGVVSYSASMPVDAEGTQFTVALAREKDTGAPSSVATLPAAFTLTPVTGTFSRADAGPTFNWAPASSDPMTLSVTGSCINDFSVSLPSNSTSYSIAKGALTTRTSADGGTANGSNCDATAQLERTQTGSLDKGFGGGSVVGIQRRSTTFGTTP